MKRSQFPYQGFNHMACGQYLCRGTLPSEDAEEILFIHPKLIIQEVERADGRPPSQKAKVQLQALWKTIPFHKIKYGSDSSEDEEEYRKNVALGNRMADEAFAINPHDEVDEVEVDEAENEREDKDEGKDKHEDCWEGHPIPSPLPK